MLQNVYLHDELVVTDVPYNDLEKQVDVQWTNAWSCIKSVSYTVIPTWEPFPL